MAVTRIDPCDTPLNPLCDVGGQILGPASASVANLVLGALGEAFVTAAQVISETAFAALDATSRIDLTAAWFRQNLALIAVITLPAVVGLFVLQVITSVLRREPGGLGRAVVGVGKAMVGSALAIAVTQMALIATDEICAVIAASAGTSVGGAARRFFLLTHLAGPQLGPVLQILFGTAIIVGCLLLWAVLLFRKAAVLLVAVFAPIAFAGLVWDQTRVWTRRWIETMAALVLCKIVIVVVFVVGISAFGSDGTTTPRSGEQPIGTSLSDLLVGLILLSIAVFAPWLTWRFVHWSGMEAASVLTGTMAASPVPNAMRATASQARFMVQSAATTMLLGGAGAAAGAGAGAGAKLAGGGAGTATGSPAPAPTPPPPSPTSPTSAAAPTADGSGRGRSAAATATLARPRPESGRDGER